MVFRIEVMDINMFYEKDGEHFARLFLYSGGVKSVAMLSIADSDDIILNIRDKSFLKKHNSHDNMVRCTNFYKLKFNFANIYWDGIEGIEPDPNAHPLTTIMPMASFSVRRFPPDIQIANNLKGIKEVCIGASIEDDLSVYDEWIEGWQRMHSQTEIVFPGKDLTRQEQYDKHIPNELKEYVPYDKLR